MRSHITRRDFLTGLGAGAAAATVSQRIGLAQLSAKAIPTRPFGKTGRELPILGYGGAALPKKWANPLSTGDRVKLVRYAYDRGVRFFDTAGNYMESQSIIGEALKGIRKHAYLVTKVETTDPAQVRRAVEKSLEELQTDYLDAILIHGTPGLEQMTVERAMQIHGELLRLRDEKIVRSIGFSAHSYFDKALALISSGGFEQCMLSYGYLPRGYNQVFSAPMVELRNACVAQADERGMGIVAMKVVGGGILGARSGRVVPELDKKRLRQLPGAAIRYALDDKRVDLLVIGMRLRHEVDANIETLSSDVTYTDNDRALLAEFSAKALGRAPLKTMRVD